MKKLSIKIKVTLWYTLLIVVLMLFILFFLFISADHVILSKAKADLKNMVEVAIEEIDYDEGMLEIDDDFLPYNKGVYVSVFQNDTLIAGQSPKNFPSAAPNPKGNVYETSIGKDKWLVFDVYINTNSYIRGVYPLYDTSQTMNQILLIAFISFPFLALIAAVGGYFITKNAFRPITKICHIANSIADGTGLSKRIDLPDCGDEVSELSKTFDSMFDRLERSFQSEKQFTSDVSHELRTPIAIMKAQCEYALLEDHLSASTAKALFEILNQINQMTLLISQLLELSRMEHYSGILQFEKVNCSELLEVVTEELMITAETKSILLVLNADPDITLYCEQTLIMRLMINLITNAIKYTPNNRQVVVNLVKEHDKVLFSVKDNGIGMEPEHLDKIFHRFYQVDPARTKDAAASFGLGLSFCKWIVSEHKGTISVESKVGKGSQFTVTLPCLQLHH